MPIKLLNRIRRLSESKHVIKHDVRSDASRESNANIEGIYVMCCSDLKARELLFNDGHPSLILSGNHSDLLTIEVEGEEKVFKSAWVCCGEIKMSYMHVPKELEYLIVARFKKNAFYNIFDIQPQTFKNNGIVNLEAIANSAILKKIEESFLVSDLDERVGFLQNVFNSIEQINEYPALLEHSLEIIRAKEGALSVSELHSYLGVNLNTKWIQRNFVKYMGLPPKKYIALQRFIKTHHLMEENKRQNILSLAIDNGYYDHNHLLKEFKKYTGSSPNTYIKTLL